MGSELVQDGMEAWDPDRVGEAVRCSSEGPGPWDLSYTLIWYVKLDELHLSEPVSSFANTLLSNTSSLLT